MRTNRFRQLGLAALAVCFLAPCVLLVLPLAGQPPETLWQAVSAPDYLRAYRNTLLLALGGVLVQTGVALPAGCFLARLAPGRVRQICLALCLLLMLLPQYLLLQTFGLLDTLAGLLLMTAFQPWMVLLFWFGTSRIDRELFDAAACDGAAGLSFCRRIYLPLMAPYLAAAALLSMAESWNLLEQPMIFLQQQANDPLSILLSRLPGASPVQKLFAGVLFALPLVILFGLVARSSRPPRA